jgi:hypothetical protein
MTQVYMQRIKLVILDPRATFQLYSYTVSLLKIDSNMLIWYIRIAMFVENNWNYDAIIHTFKGISTLLIDRTFMHLKHL